MISKKKVIKSFGGTIPEVSITLGMSQQRIIAWHDEMTKREIDGVIAALVRQQNSNGKTDEMFYIQGWLLK